MEMFQKPQRVQWLLLQRRLVTPVSSTSTTRLDLARFESDSNNNDANSISTSEQDNSNDSTIGPSDGFEDDITDDGFDDNHSAKNFAWFTMSVIIVIVIFVLWRLWIRYRRRVEQRMLDYRSAQADKVLGDMQMVPNMDLDDNELI